MPSFSKTPARKSAALVVSPGGFEVSMATYSERSRVISSRLPVSCVAETEDTKETKDTQANTASSRARAGKRRFMFSSVSFVRLCVLDAFSHRLECAGVPVLTHAVPVEVPAVHRDVDACRQRLD